jgi:hypothetical protein
MKFTNLVKTMIALLCMGTTAQAAETIHCKSWDTFKEKVSVDIELNGNRALINMDLDGQKESTSAVVQPWHNFTPNRCGTSASGLQFEFSLPNVHHLHVVTEASGWGCYAPSTISYDGTEYAGIYLTCDGLSN